MTDNQRQLRKELVAAGASEHELSQLMPIANRLSTLRKGDAPRRQPLFGASGWRRALKPAVYVSLGLAMGLLLVVGSQAALPTSWLFPVQKASDGVAMRMHPQYRANVMMKRAHQVNQLVANHASTPEVLATLADYTKVANTYKSMPHTNYAAFEYCENSLEQASIDAPPAVQKAITASLWSLEES